MNSSLYTLMILRFKSIPWWNIWYNFRDVPTLLKEHSLMAEHATFVWDCQNEEFCGWDIEYDGIHAQQHITCVVINWPESDNCKDVWCFLGLPRYHRNFIGHYAHTTMPLYAMGTPPNDIGDVGWWCGELRKVCCPPCAWDTQWQHAFDTCKNVHCNAPVLALPYPEAKYCVHVDASQYELGTVLSQVQDNA